MKSNKIKVLISGYYGFSNFGDETILSILTSKLKELGYDITVFSSNPQKTKNLYNVKTENSFDIKKLVPIIYNNDILISGGGSLLQDTTSIKSLIYYLVIINIALFLRKKTIIFAQGLGPISNKFCAFLTKQTLKRCSYLCVRDRKSRLILKKWNISSDLVCDPIFSLPLPEYNPENIIGIQLRKFKNLNLNYLKNLAKSVIQNFEGYKIEVYSFQDSLDLDICKTFEKYIKEIKPEQNVEVISNASSQEILNRFSKLKYLAAMRFHANLIAIKFGIKTLALSYDIKVDKLAEEAEIPCLQLKSDDDLEKAFLDMKALNSERLKQYANSKEFDWRDLQAIMQ